MMPRGTRHELTGILLDDRLYPILRVADGGEWRLDISKQHQHLLGRRVKVRGIRDGFDLLAVDHIEPA